MESNFPKLEEEVLKRWKEEKAFEKSLARRKAGKRFVFYEGPPTANGSPGIHHVLSRSFKDAVCRYKTMRGFYVERKAGWDTHGLPVELQVEKKLGLTSKKEIEKYGIAKFNKECKQSVWEYKKEWDELTHRIGFWLDTDNPYITYEKGYMESLWWVMKQFWNKGLLYKSHKVVPYCPRCGTPLSSHELAQGYKTVKEKSVYAKFKLKGEQNTYILAWTTTPWTLPGNVALAVGEKIPYVFIKQEQETYILAKNLLEKLEGEYNVVKEVLGKKLEGLEYEPLFDSLKSQPEKKHYVALADFVSTEDGTGIVHTAVMYGEDDYRLGTKLGLPKKHTVDEEGKFNELVPQWKGMFVKDVEHLIIEDLKKRSLLYKEEMYEHEYPFCWRCSTPLLYFAKDSWFVNMQKVKKELVANNQSVNWIPPHIKNGRMGEWLAEVKDWAFSRERYWGTPLPVWECEKCDHKEVIESLEDLKKKTEGNTYFLMRHGESERQKLNIVSSWPEKKPLPLTVKGRKDVEKVATELKTKKVDLIFSSDLLRTKETAEIVAKELGIEVFLDKRLRENDTGIHNGKGIEDAVAIFKREGETPTEHYMRRFEIGHPEGENWMDVQKRVHEFIRDMENKYPEKRILVVSHGLPLLLFEASTEGWSREKTAEAFQKNLIQPAGWKKVLAAYLPYNDEMEVDLHRPYVDEVNFACSSCKEGSMKRVKDVVDVWFDSGAMPYASALTRATASKQGKVSPPKPYPADYIVEAIDQTRGWFYTLLAVSTVLGLKAPYKNVISLGHILDEKGEKMSKSKGNIVKPQDMIEKYGVDTLRWYFFTLNHPWDSKAFVERDLQQAMRKFILTLWNSFVFYQTYADKKAKKVVSKNILDRWIVSRLQSITKEATKKLDEYDITGAARLVESFVIEDLSLWYIRRSRQRFQNPKDKKELQEASATLKLVLSEVSKLAAPLIPFLSEHIYRELREKGSVHWQDYPKVDAKKMSKALEKEMEQIRGMVTTILAERAKAGIKVRQPLSALHIKKRISRELQSVLADEVNVKEVRVSSKIKGEIELDTNITPALKREGTVREIVRHIQEMRKKAGYKPQDKIELDYTGDEEIKEILREQKKEIMTTAGLEKVTEGDGKRKFDMEQEFLFDNKKLKIGIYKA
jgi:isoleucyl-tRNA synthetase